MIVSHIFAKSEILPPVPTTDLYQYVVAANGIFVRAVRTGLSVMVWVAPAPVLIRGLVPLSPYVHTSFGRVPARITARIFELAYRASYREILHERLFYLEPMPWRLVLPEQISTVVSVRPAYSYDGKDAMVEVHSHHDMAPYFSSMDDRDERGFRIYAVIGNLRIQPAIHVRVSVYGHFYSIPASTIFDLPLGVDDSYLPELAWRMEDGD